MNEHESPSDAGAESAPGAAGPPDQPVHGNAQPSPSDTSSPAAAATAADDGERTPASEADTQQQASEPDTQRQPDASAADTQTQPPASDPSSTGGGGQPPDAPARETGSISRGRLIGIDALIVVTTILAVVGMLSVWANRLLFNPDNWENTSTELLQNADIRSAASNYIVDQLYANVNVAALLRSGLPPRLQPLADPAAGALRGVAVQGVDQALQRPVVQSLWARANRAADNTLIAVVNGRKGTVNVNNGAVTLDLGSVLDNVAARLGLPPGLSAKLPPTIATLTVFKSDQLSFVQKVGKAVKGLALWLTILVPLLYILAIFLARHHRRRTLMSVGFAIAIAGVIGIAGRAILQSAITNSLVKDEAARPAARATVGIGTELLAEIAVAFIVVGIVVVIAAWFAGPARPAKAGRRTIAPFLRDQPVWCFAIVAAVMLLIFIWQPIHAAGTPVGIIAFLALALIGTEVLRRQTAVEFPDAHSGDSAAHLRARFDSFRESRQSHRHSSTHSSGSLPEQLEHLASLRDKGAITPEEYDAAKAQLLRQ